MPGPTMQRMPCKTLSAVTAFLGYSGRFLTRNLAKLGCNKVCEPWTFKMCTQEHPRTPNGPKIDECSRWAHLLVCDKFRSECESFGYRMGGEVSCVTRPCIVGFQINNEYHPLILSVTSDDPSSTARKLWHQSPTCRNIACSSRHESALTGPFCNVYAGRL